MKLSDIDDMKKLAEEYKVAKTFYDFIVQHKIFTAKIDVVDQHNMSALMNVSHRSTEGNQFFADLVIACKSRVEILQTKLALYGVDKFE